MPKLRDPPIFRLTLHFAADRRSEQKASNSARSRIDGTSSEPD